MIPRATLRLQLHRGFTFRDARAQLDYYAALGISHLYLSPIFCARPGSTHGYDVTDVQRINPELGGPAGFRALAHAARAHGLGLILDIVPNHMAACPVHNAWWRDVLRHGRHSAYAPFFDIDWQPPEPALHGKVLLPVLARPYPQTLRHGTIRLMHDEGARPTMMCGELPLPLADDSLGILEPLSPAAREAACDPRTHAGRNALHALLERQHYRVAWWRTARDMLNWRRFFEVSELVGVCVEREAVFEATHALVLSLMRQGLIDGVRVDHVDGLADPAGYCRRLRARLDAVAPRAQSGTGSDVMRPWIVVEKILAEDEHLPADWQVDGTTGYDAMSEIGAVLHDAHGIERLRDMWASRSGTRPGGTAQIVATRHALVTEALVTEWRRATRALEHAACEDPTARDLTGPALARAVAELLAQMQVYRTYFTARSASRGRCADRRRLRQAAVAARTRLRRDDWAALAFIVRVLQEARPDQPAACAAQARLQQTMPPVSAKAIEDTLFYRDGTLLSRNEVGTSPCAPALSPDVFLARAQARARRFPHAMLATATHDHKRGEDTRMRLAVISELPQLWRSHVARLEGRRSVQADSIGRKAGEAPDEADRLMLYQALVGAWPLELADPTLQTDARDAFLARIRAWQRKAIREAGRHGDWSHPDLAYEASAEACLNALQDSGLDHIAALAQRLSVAGALNSLTQTWLQHCLPGVPDRYQGTETWDFTLVDPDNRGAVDYDQLRIQFHSAAPAEQSIAPDWARLQAGWRDGRIKQQLIRTLLEMRRTHAAIFDTSALQPLEADGAHAARVLAFVRGHGQHLAIAIGTRLAASLLEDCMQPCVPARRWEDTCVAVPPAPGGAWVDYLTGTHHPGPTLLLSAVLADLPVAVLVPASAGTEPGMPDTRT